MVAADDPLDTYLVHHPEALFDRPVEAAVLDPENPYVLAPHLAAAAAELPLTDADLDVFGPTMPALVEALVRARAAAPPTGRVVLDPRRPGHRPRLAARVRARWCASSSAGPAGCSAPSTGRRPTAASTPAPSTCTRGRPTSSPSSTWTTPHALVTPR